MARLGAPKGTVTFDTQLFGPFLAHSKEEIKGVATFLLTSFKQSGTSDILTYGQSIYRGRFYCLKFIYLYVDVYAVVLI